jgi:hypothetical protein
MPRVPERRPRLVALLLVFALVTGLAATASAAPALPSCRVADTLAKHRWLSDWHRSLLDVTYRLSSAYVPGDLRSTSYAGLNGGYYVRRHVVADLKAMAAAARAAGARLAVQSAYRSFKTQKSTFDYWRRCHDCHPELRRPEYGMQACEQEDASLDHRRGVQVRADRRGRLHGVRQPEMEGRLGRLREGPNQNEYECRGVQGVGGDGASLHLESADHVGTARFTQQQDTRKQGQTAAAGDEQRLQGGRAGRCTLVIESDQQIGADTGELPEDEERKQAVGERDAEHRTHEDQQVRVEPSPSGIIAEVGARIDQDQCAHSGDEQRKETSETVEPEGELHVECWRPCDQLAHRFWSMRDEPGEHAGRHGGEEPRRGTRQDPLQQRSREGDTEDRA